MNLSILTKALLASLLAAAVTPSVWAACPYLDGHKNDGGARSQPQLPYGHPGMPSLGTTTQHTLNRRKLDTNASGNRVGDGGIPKGGFAAVAADIEAMLTDSKDFWPADEVHETFTPATPTYAPFLLRLAWHCAGSYRQSDGRGGCDGARIRHAPESNWPDNLNLDKALQLLQPIKNKYGSKLSWGDLIILAGNVAIESMGGWTYGFCGGRIDDADGSASLILGPSKEQEELSPCQTIGEQGHCQSPLGPSTVGLIYVNAEGPVDEKTGEPDPDPVQSAKDIREIFARMGMNDRETVALVGGAHNVGKCHGPCLNPPCGSGALKGKGPNTWTSGLEGPWVTTPTKWGNIYFKNLFRHQWELITGPGGGKQWMTPESPHIMMLTSDMAFGPLGDPDYAKIADSLGQNRDAMEEEFAKAWYKLTNFDMGPKSRCIGEQLPWEEFPWQYNLPAPPATKPDYVEPRSMIQAIINSDSSAIEAFSNLAYRCASTFRDTDYKGGCDGARIRFSPQSEWPSNAGTSDALAMLDPVKKKHPDVSYADLIVLAGQTAIESAGGNAMDFCGGRTDASNADFTDILAPRVYKPAVVSIRDDMLVKGLSAEEGVALFGRPAGRTRLSNQFFKDLKAGVGSFTDEELALLEDDEFSQIVDTFASNNARFQTAFAEAWTYMMTADRFDGPQANACTGVSDKTKDTRAPPPPVPTPAPAPTNQCRVEVTRFMLVDGVSDEAIRILPRFIDYSKLYKKDFNVRAIVKGCPGEQVKSVLFTMENGHSFCDSAAPWSLYGDTMGDFKSKTISLGDYSLTASPYTRRNCVGTPGESRVQRFSAVGKGLDKSCPGAPVYFALFNADTKKRLGPIKNGMRICRPRFRFSIKATVVDCQTSETASVLFKLQSDSINFRSVDSGKDFFLFGGERKDFDGRKVKSNAYTINARAFSGLNAKGVKGGGLRTSFEFVEPRNAPDCIYG